MSTNALAKFYQKKVVPKLLQKLGLKSRLAVPRLVKIVVNFGLGEAVEDKKVIEKAKPIVASLTGQKPKETRAKAAISGFKLRQGVTIGLMVTLRGEKMFDFLEKLTKIVLPRLRDFQGVSRRSFDGHGNYTLGLQEQIVFPEVDYEKIDKTRGLEITLVTSTDSDRQAQILLEELGLPFEKNKPKKKKNSLS
jgi:large subunit ribosomal protein L5